MNARLLPVVVMTSVALLAQGQPPTRVVPPAPASAPRGVRFDDVTTSAGLDGVRHVSGSAAKEYIPETTGSGVALVDADGDGWLDLFVAGDVEFDVAHPPPSPSTPASPTTPAADAASSGQGMGAVYAATRAPRRARPPVPQQRGRDVHRDDARGGRRGPRATRRGPG